MEERIQQIVVDVLNKYCFPPRPYDSLPVDPYKVGQETVWHIECLSLHSDKAEDARAALEEAGYDPRLFLFAGHPFRAVKLEGETLTIKLPSLTPRYRENLETQIEGLKEALGCEVSCEYERMTLQETIVNSIRYYPGIQPTRETVLNHLFCVIGNGFDWAEGALVNGEVYEGDPEQRLREWSDEFSRNHPMSHDIPGVEERRLKRLEEEIQKSREAEERAKPGYPHDFSRGFEGINPCWDATNIYPLCQYSKIMTVPPNVRPDWLEGAVEVIDMVRGLGEVEDDRSADNLKWIEKARVRLAQMFPHLEEHEWTEIGSTAPPLFVVSDEVKERKAKSAKEMKKRPRKGRA